MTLFDTICAIATPVGEGGIGIVRVSGPGAIKIAETVFKSNNPSAGKPKEFESRRLYYGMIFNPSDNTPIDNVLMTIMKCPASFTGEDVAEFHCHGGQLVMQRALELIARHGARLAEPGEFTRRAFLNGKIDLAQAEAVIDLIRAKTDLSMKAAHAQLDGALSRKINSIKENILDMLALIEAGLDFSEEEDVTILSDADISTRLNEINSGLEKLLSTYDEGMILKDGLSCIILGRPNVGKSSLLNLLLQEERAIVTSTPGTTRDIIEEIVNIKGIPLRLMDTAGLRETGDEAESIGIRFTMKRLETSRLVLLVVDMQAKNFDEDLKILEKAKDKKVIIIGNKMDSASSDSTGLFRKVFEGLTRIEISALRGEGIEELKQAVYNGAVWHDRHEAGEIVVTNARHKTSLENAHKAVLKAMEAVRQDLAGEFVAVELKEALERLGEITGAVTTEDVLERIFSRFCIGK